MKKTTLTVPSAVTSAVFALATVSAAHAADLPRRQVYKAPAYTPTYVAPFTWTGLYGGVMGGYGWGNSTMSGATGSSDVTPRGAFVGETLGYNWQSGAFVFGLEGDLAYSWMRATNGASAPCANCEVRNHYLGTVRGRIGYAFDRWLPYVTGGLAVGDIKTSAPTGAGQDTTKAGWVLGGGFEYAFIPRWSAKLEYMYVDLGSANCDAAHCGISVDTNFHANLVRAGLNYHF